MPFLKNMLIFAFQEDCSPLAIIGTILSQQWAQKSIVCNRPPYYCAHISEGTEIKCQMFINNINVITCMYIWLAISWLLVIGNGFLQFLKNRKLEKKIMY